MADQKNALFYIEGISKGDVSILSQAITLIESTKVEHQAIAHEMIQELIPRTGNSFRLGITGVPGVGKSTFIESFGLEVLKKGHKLAVLAIDPSSAKSKGSILGDKTRMEKLSGSKDAYIRPSPSAGNLGGVAKSTYQSMLLCEAAGYDYIIIETVGTGQSEITVAGMTDFFLLLMLAGAGDELQGIKRGIMEMADALIITKADGDNLAKAKLAKAEYTQALHLFQPQQSGWIPRTGICSSINHTGIREVYDIMDEFKRWNNGNDFIHSKRKQQQFDLMLAIVNEQLVNGFKQNMEVSKLLNELKTQNTFDPYATANSLLAKYYSSFSK